MSAQPSPRLRTASHATARPGSRNRGDGARASLTVAPEVARRRLRARLLVWAAALVTVVSLFTLVAFHVFAEQSAFALERLSKERTNEQLRYERLRLEVATSSSAPAVIAAAQKLGMVPAPSVVNLELPAGAVAAEVSAPGPTAAQSSPGTGSYAQTKRALGPVP